MATRVAKCHRFDKLSVITDEINKRYPSSNVAKKMCKMFDVKDVCTSMTFVAI